MLMVYLLPQGGDRLSFQIPCRLAGCEPGRELAMQQIPRVLEVERRERLIATARKAPSRAHRSVAAADADEAEIET